MKFSVESRMSALASAFLLALGQMIREMSAMVAAVVRSVVQMPSIKALYVPKNFPPGPVLPLPILRYTPGTRYFKKSFVEIVKMLSEENRGGAFSLHLGHKRVVVLADLDAVKTVYGRQMNRRPDTSVGDWRENRFGVIFSNGQDWHEQRKMFVSSLHKTGLRRANVEASFERLWRRVRAVIEANICMDDAAEITPSKFDLSLTDYVFSLVCKQDVIANKLKPNSHQALKNINYDRTLGIQWCESRIWFRYALARILAPRLTGYEDARSKMHAAMASMREIVQQHSDTIHERDDDEQDFIDLYLKKVDSERDAARGWSGEVGMSRLMGALDTIPLGSDGLFIAFNTIIYCLSRFGEEQEQLRREIEEAEEDGWDNVVYLKAFVMEVLRFSQTAGIGPVKNAPDSKTDVYPNADYMMNDEAVWTEPRKFNPDRFLKEGKVVTPPQWMPFGVGPRACPGQNFSMDTLTNITARIVRDYRVEFSRFLAPRKFAEEETTEMVSLGLRKYRDFAVKITRTERCRAEIAAGA